MMIAARLAVAVFAGTALYIAANILPFARQIDQARALTSSLMNRADLPVEKILAARAEMRAAIPAGSCMPDGEAADLMMTAWLADHTWTQMRPAELDALQAEAKEIALRSIRCNPAHPLGWLVYARFRILTHGVDDASLDIIRHTYAIAASEGWAMSMRAGMMIGLRKSLVGKDREWLINDLRGLVISEAQNDVADLLSRTELPFQQEIAAQFSTLPYEIQRRYQSAAVRIGVDVSKLSIPPSSAEPMR